MSDQAAAPEPTTVDAPDVEIEGFDEALRSMLDTSSVVVEIAQMMGTYRSSLVAEGFPEDIADEMCRDYHLAFVCGGSPE